MELEQFKNDLNKWLGAQPANKSETEIGAILKGRHTSAIQKIKRNMGRELLWGVVAIAAIAFFMPYSGILRWVVGLGAVVTALQGAGFWWQSQKLKESPLENNLKITLKEQIIVIEQFIRHYLRFNVVVFVVAMIVGLLLGYEAAHSNEPDVMTQLFDQLLPGNFILTVLAALLLLFLSWQLIRWWIQFGYGRHLNDLKQCLRELEEQETSPG